uniref:Uncharacterized protein n=1 Tax=Oryza barthii TaxID=65489 RepID=A0A0D3HCJ8_9ORYZ
MRPGKKRSNINMGVVERNTPINLKYFSGSNMSIKNKSGSSFLPLSSLGILLNRNNIT